MQHAARSSLYKVVWNIDPVKRSNAGRTTSTGATTTSPNAAPPLPATPTLEPEEQSSINGSAKTSGFVTPDPPDCGVSPTVTEKRLTPLDTYDDFGGFGDDPIVDEPNELDIFGDDHMMIDDAAGHRGGEDAGTADSDMGIEQPMVPLLIL